MTGKPELLRIPTERDGVMLKTVTAVDDEAWLLSNRMYGYPAPPSNPSAPDHEAFLKLRKAHTKEDPDKLNMGIWDLNRFKNDQGKKIPAFAGYIELRPDKDSESSAIIGYRISEKYQRYGYASTALSAIMKYGRHNLGIETFKAEITQSNYASQQMVEKLGFEQVDTRHRVLIYAHTMPSSVSSEPINPDTQAA